MKIENNKISEATLSQTSPLRGRTAGAGERTEQLRMLAALAEDRTVRFSACMLDAA